MVNKCIEHINCPTELGLYFDAPVPTIVKLKSLIACQYLNGAIPPRLTLTFTIAPNTTVTVIDDLCCCEGTACHPAAWHSKLSFYLHSNSTLVYHLGTPSKECDKDTDEKSCVVEKELNFILLGKNAQAHATCSCRGTGSSSYTFTTVQEHKAPHTTSSLTIKGALTDQARLKNNALIKVYKGCNAVQASQVNKNLLLSPGTRALSIPKLEIETDDVQCRHDATMGKLNQEQLFYLQSRGLSLTQAQNDLIAAFLG